MGFESTDLSAADPIKQAVLSGDAKVAIGLNSQGSIACSCWVGQEHAGSEFVGSRLHRTIAGAEEQPASEHRCRDKAAEQ